MKDISSRFNAYKFNQDHDVTGYSENGLSSKKIGFYTYVSENEQGREENDPQDSQKKVAQEKVLKYVEYEVIYDSHTKRPFPCRRSGSLHGKMILICMTVLNIPTQFLTPI